MGEGTPRAVLEEVLPEKVRRPPQVPACVSHQQKCLRVEEGQVSGLPEEGGPLEEGEQALAPPLAQELLQAAQELQRQLSKQPGASLSKQV